MTNTNNDVAGESGASAGIDLPKIGLGTYRLNGTEGANSIARAIDAGYRLVDSAFNYENEGAVGKAVRITSVPREELVITSKLPGRHHEYHKATLAIEESLLRMGLDHIDLYLIHWPLPKVDKYVEAWQALLDAQARGLVRWVGVSNFLPEHLERLEQETGVLPAVNQVQMHPYFPDTSLLDYDRSRGITTEAWSPLGRGRDLLGEPVIVEVANAHNATPAQTVLAWHIARGVVPIPKSATPERQISNLGALDITLTPDEVRKITALGRANGRVLDLDPATHEEF